MKIDNPKVTLADEARNGVEEDVRSGFLDWLFSTSLTDESGNKYMLGGSILSLAQEKTDIMTMKLTCGYGSIEQLPQSIYKLARFPGLTYQELTPFPEGTLTIDKKDDMVIVECTKGYHVECYKDNSWKIVINSQDGRLSAELIHTPFGYPLWYGRKTPSALTQHSITYGYNFAGDVKGTMTFDGVTHTVTGKGIRERYVAVDSCSAELGGWEDWGFVAFDELYCSLYDMRLGMKDFAINIPDEGIYIPEGKLTIEHEDWAFLRSLGGFIPAYYNITIESEQGTLKVHAHSANASTWGVTHKFPDNPVATLLYDTVDGTFTFPDGKVKTLTNGHGTMSIRQWQQYPQILPPELFSDEQLTSSDMRFQTL